jgi:phosphoenolpyruvate synthase/pyruvate phosphate dikinase
MILNSSKEISKKQMGAKAFNLFLLSKEGFLIPSFMVISTKTFLDFKKENNLDKKINEQLKTITKKSTIKEINKISKNIQELIQHIKLSKKIVKKIKNQHLAFNGKILAVRSSAVEEDSLEYSFAGQFDSFLGIKTPQETINAVIKCWMSLFSSRSINYRLINNLSLKSEDIKMAVILQEMILGEKSGVMFTHDPVTGNDSSLIINSVLGLGNKLVSGEADSDSYSIDKKSFKIVNQKTIENNPHLNSMLLENLSKTGIALEKFYHKTQDIEWTIKDKKIYILQSRPITTKKEKEDYLYIWDNSNIVESYGGLTLPLTFTFARYVYHQVYVQFCEVLLVPKKEIRKMDYFLKNMLGLHFGRVYYNLLNWYKLTSIIPGYRFNREFMETMMGTQKHLESEIADRIRPAISRSPFIQMLTGFKFLYFHFVIQKRINDFLDYFNTIYQKYRKLNYTTMRPHEILSIYYELENKLLREWKAPIINDYLCMVHFGILKKLTNLWLKKNVDSIQNDLLCGEGNIESTEPTRELIKISRYIHKNKKLKKLLIHTPSEKCMETVQKSNDRKLQKKIHDYIDLYGYRCMNEMKLEEKDLYQDSSFLFVCLKNYLQNKNIISNDYQKKEKEIRKNAEEKVRNQLNIFQQYIYFWSLKNTRIAVKNRENTRFCRTRIYGVVRSWFFNIGQRFAEMNILEKAEDIFYLELNELLGSLEGTLSVQNLKQLVVLRKNEYEQYKNIQLENRFVTRGPVYWNNSHIIPQTKIKSDTHLQGLGCSPGKITGTVRIIQSSIDAEKLNGEILVTTRTDPGWIPLYPSISGLIVERGSLLSHSAIVAREMGIPTIIALTNVTQTLSTGSKISMDGTTGQVEILSRN